MRMAVIETMLGDIPHVARQVLRTCRAAVVGDLPLRMAQVEQLVGLRAMLLRFDRRGADDVPKALVWAACMQAVQATADPEAQALVK